MKKYIFALVLIITAFFGGYSINSFAISKSDSPYRIAYVDVQDIVLNSAELNTLKVSQENRLQEMQILIEKAKAEIAKETNPQKAAQLEEKYRTQINNQKISLDTEYNKQLSLINNKIKTAVAEKARSLNYNIVLSKNTVLFGGDDITEQVKGLVK